MIDAAIRAMLTAHPTVVALVGDRIRPTQAAQDDAKPRITFSSDDADMHDCFDGPATHANQSFQVDIIASTVTQARAIVQAVRLALHFKAGTFGGVKVEIIRFTGTTDLTPSPTDGEEQPDAHFAMSFSSLIQL